MFNINEISNLDEPILKDNDVENTISDSSKHEIDVSALPIDIVLGEKYQEYVDLEEKNEVQRQKNEELRSTIKRVQIEIDERKKQLLDDIKSENEKLISEGSLLESELNSLLGIGSSSEEII